MFRACFFLISLTSCSALIYDLNDTEYARLPPLFELASYSRCLSQHGTYCVLQLSLEPGDNHQLWNTIQEYSAYAAKHYNYNNIDRGLCVTETCREYIIGRTEELKAPLEACLNSWVRRAWGVGVRVSALHYCERHDDRARIDAWDCAVRAALLALAAINAAATLYDYREKKWEEGNPWILCFSFKRNWERLTRNEVLVDDPMLTKELQFLHGIRVMANICVLILHAVMYYTVGFTRNPHDVEKSYDTLFYQLNYHGLVLVQLFFFMSGFLMVYYLREEEKKRAFTVWDVPKIMLLRLSRLVPALAMTLALATSWARHAGSGPLWKLFVTQHVTGVCRTSWWHNLLFINNYTEHGKHCVAPTWYLAADMQVFVLGVTAYTLAGRWRRAVLCCFLVVGILAPALHTVFEDLDILTITPEAFRALESRPFWNMHALGHNNLTCFVMGMLVVTAVCDRRKQKGLLRHNRWHSLCQYVVLICIPLLMYSSVPLTGGARATMTLRVSYNATIRLAMGALCAVGVPTFFTDTPTYLQKFLSWRHWVVPSRLSYCVYLLHMPLLLMMLGSNSDLTHFSFANTMHTTLSIVVISFLFALPMYLMVEAPFNAVFKLLTGRSSAVNGTVKAKCSNGESKINSTSKTIKFL